MVGNKLDGKLRIIESGYGRDLGWDLEHCGRCIAVLTEPRWAEMFWVVYRIDPATDDPKILEMLHSDEFWGSCDYIFRSRRFPEDVAEHAFGYPAPQGGEVCVRGAYLTIEEPTTWESLRCFRRLWRARRRFEACDG